MLRLTRGTKGNLGLYSTGYQKLPLTHGNNYLEPHKNGVTSVTPEFESNS